MKCRKCGEKAVLNMRQHKLALCKEHFLSWVPEQTQRFIEKYAMFEKGDRVLVAVSGGKDSLGLWDVLDTLGYEADGLYIGLGIDGGFEYSNASRRYAADFAEQRGHTLHLVDVPTIYGTPISTAARVTARGKGKPCSVCGLTRRHIMNRVALEGGYDVLVTGHNLDDEAATLFGNTLQWATGYLSRQGPVLQATRDGLVRKAKPFCRLYEREIAAYTLLRGVEYMYEECPFSEGANSIYYKELLNKLEHDRPGAKLAFYLSFLRAKEAGFFSEDSGSPSAFHRCRMCGQPTSAPDQCAFCRTWELVQDAQP